jgi:hypothetical protein
MMNRAKPIGHQYANGAHPAFEGDDDFELPSMFRSQRDSKAKGDIRAVARAQLPTMLAGPGEAIPRQMVSFKDTLMSRMAQPRRRPGLGAADGMTPDASSPGQSIDEEQQGAFDLVD